MNFLEGIQVDFFILQCNDKIEIVLKMIWMNLRFLFFFISFCLKYLFIFIEKEMRSKFMILNSCITIATPHLLNE